MTPKLRVALTAFTIALPLDQLTKIAIDHSLSYSDRIEIIEGLFYLTHVRNTGAAFGILNAADFPFKATIIALIATFALIGVGVYAAGLAPHQRVARIGLSLILGGALGNLVDRILSGYVVDFVDVYWRDYHFWAFNVADAAITIGVAVLILDMLGLGRVPSTL